ncbi:MAG: hypothetical protein QGG53_36260 [Planctomycetota bacterium]|nr:hypothetical protein [Planctomycetota bacterium]
MSDNNDKQLKERVSAVLSDKEALQLVHVHFSANSFNDCWTYIEKEERTDEDVENMLLLANTSLWHWTQRSDCTPQNLSIAYWQLGRVNCLAGDTALAQHYGEKCIEISKENKLGPFCLGYGYEVMADASVLKGNKKDAEKYLQLATDEMEKVQDKFDRDLLQKDIERIRKLVHAQLE